MKNLENKTSFVKKGLDVAKQGFDWSKNHINYKVGAAGSAICGSMAFYENYSHGFYEGIKAAAIQAGFVFVAGGYNSKTCQKLAKKFDLKNASIVCASVLTTLQAGVLMYGAHKLFGTPEAANTALGIAQWNVLAFGVIAYIARLPKENKFRRALE